MEVAAIIAEYNPLHNGHAYQIEQTKKETGADYVIAFMSGDFVQRGAPALLDKYTRTRMALLCGADAVIEAAGKDGTFQLAWKIARPNAVISLLAMYEEDQVLPLPSMYGKNLTWKSGGVDACKDAYLVQLISASITASAPRPSVSSLTRASTSSFLELMNTSAQP